MNKKHVLMNMPDLDKFSGLLYIIISSDVPIIKIRNIFLKQYPMTVKKITDIQLPNLFITYTMGRTKMVAIMVDEVDAALAVLHGIEIDEWIFNNDTDEISQHGLF